MRIAIFGDIHGRVLMPFLLISRWQQVYGESIDYALSIGDFGAYRGFYNMEKTSQRWAKKYPEELGFSKFLYRFDLKAGKIIPHPAATDLFDQVSADLYFVAGNHEEHDFLKEIRDQYASSAEEAIPIDVDWKGISDGKYSDTDFSGYSRIYNLPQGPVVALDGPLDSETWQPAYQLNLNAVNGIPAYTPKKAWGQRSDPVDILLTHDTYAGRLQGISSGHRSGELGSPRLCELIERICPKFHFFGHHHGYYEETEYPTSFGITRSVGLNQLIFRTHTAPISPECFGILNVSASKEMDFKIVDDDWFKRIRWADCLAYL